MSTGNEDYPVTKTTPSQPSDRYEKHHPLASGKLHNVVLRQSQLSPPRWGRLRVFNRGLQETLLPRWEFSQKGVQTLLHRDTAPTSGHLSGLRRVYPRSSGTWRMSTVGSHLVPLALMSLSIKRHHVRRFFPKPTDKTAADQNSNPLPGTLIERGSRLPSPLGLPPSLLRRHSGH